MNNKIKKDYKRMKKQNIFIKIMTIASILFIALMMNGEYVFEKSDKFILEKPTLYNSWDSFNWDLSYMVYSAGVGLYIFMPFIIGGYLIHKLIDLIYLIIIYIKNSHFGFALKGSANSRKITDKKSMTEL